MFVAVLTEPIDVHVSSGTDWITPVSILLAGLLAACLSWITHRRTLRHEGLLREREATRRALDGVVDEINRAADVLGRAGEASGDLERALPDRGVGMSQENLELVRSIFAAWARCQVKTAPKARAAAERLAEKRAQADD